VVEGVEPALVIPRVRRRVEAFLRRGIRVHLADEGDAAVEVGVPGDRAERHERRTSQCRARIQCPLSQRQAVIKHVIKRYGRRIRTWKALGEDALVDAKRTY
jgi:hypothetical protein